MIQLTKLNRQSFMLNDRLIETIEETPDTVITTTTGKKIVVMETAAEIVEKIIAYQHQVSLALEK